MNRLKELSLTVKIAACALLSAASLHAQERLLGLLEAETDFVIGVRSISDVRNSWGAIRQHPLFDTELSESLSGGMWVGLFDEEFSGLEEMTETVFGVTPADLEKYFDGGMVFAVSSVGRIVASEEPEGLLLILEHSADPADIIALVRKAWDYAEAERVEQRVSERWVLDEGVFMGETIYQVEVYADDEDVESMFSFSVLPDLVIMGGTKGTVEDSIERVKLREHAPLSRAERFVRGAEWAPEGQFLVYADFTRMWPVLAELIRGDWSESLLEAGVPAEALLDALALDAIEGGRFSVDLVDTTPFEARASSVLLYREPVGVLSLFPFRTGLPLEAAFVPADAVGSDVSSMSLSDFFRALEALVNRINPEYGLQFAQYLEIIREQSGVDLRGGIWENFGPQMVTVSWLAESDESPSEDDFMPETNATEMVIVFDVIDPAALTLAMETIKGMASGFTGPDFLKPSEFLGETIFASEPLPYAQQFGYVVTGNRLLLCIGDIERLRAVMRRLDDSSSPGLWDQAWLREAFAPIARPNAVSRGYSNLGYVVESMADAFMMPMMMSGVDMEEVETLMEQLRGLPLKMVQESSFDPRAFSSRWRLFEKEDN